MAVNEIVGGQGGGTRKVGALLGIGVLLAPYIFAWFLLRRGYSGAARLVAFAWMVALLVTFSMNDRNSSTSQSSASDQRTVTQTMTDAMVAPQMDAIADKVARDSVKEYEIAQTGADKMEICVQAGMVVAAYKQAQDEANYLLWKQKQRNDCHDAGMPDR